MNKLAMALGALVIAGTGAASAQSLRIGPDGIGIEDNRVERRVERRFDRGYDDDRVVVRRGRDVVTTGSVERCRTTIVRRENRFGEMVTRRIRECD